MVGGWVVEHFVISNVIYKNVDKTKIRNPFFHSAAHRFKKMRFSKIANLVNAPAIHNPKIAFEDIPSFSLVLFR